MEHRKMSSAYLSAHYGVELPEDGAPRPSFPGEATDPYDALCEMAGAARMEGRAIDIGCGVGGMALRLARNCSGVVGIDVDFDALITASCVLRGIPVRQDRFPLFLDGNVSVELDLALDAPDNMDFVMASAHRLPFADGCFDVAASLNVLDVIPEPFTMVDECWRVLRESGAFLLASPYLYVTPTIEQMTADGTLPAEVVRRNLARGFTIADEREYVPWVLRSSRRKYDCYLSHCLIAERLAALRAPHTPYGRMGGTAGSPRNPTA